jgi:peroxiredoxin
LAIGVALGVGALVASGFVERLPPRPPRIEQLRAAPAVARVGDDAPDLDLPDLDGTRHRLSESRGHTVMLSFWASWCHGCIEEMPVLGELQRDLAGTGFRLVSIGVDDANNVALVESKLHPTFQILVADDVDVEPSSRFGNGSPSVLPFSVLVGPDGKILKTLRGGFTQKSEWLDWIGDPAFR